MFVVSELVVGGINCSSLISGWSFKTVHENQYLTFKIPTQKHTSFIPKVGDANLEVCIVNLVFSFLKIFVEDISPFHGATDTPVLDFW